MAEYALSNIGLELEKLRTGQIKVDDYQMDLSSVFPSFEEKEYNNPYVLDLTDVFVNDMIEKAKEENNPYLIDLTNIFKENLQPKKQTNPYAIDLSSIFPDFNEVQYNPYTMDIKSLSRKEEIHLKQELSDILENYREIELKRSKQEEEAIDTILDKYGISIQRIKSGRPSIIKIGKTLYVPDAYLERTERIFKQNNIIID